MSCFKRNLAPLIAILLSPLCRGQSYYTVDYGADRLLKVTVAGATATATVVGPLGVNVTAPPDLTLHNNVLYMTAVVGAVHRVYQVPTNGLFAGMAVGGSPLVIGTIPVVDCEGLSTDINTMRVSYSNTVPGASTRIGRVDVVTGQVTPEFALPFDGDGLARIGSVLWAIDGNNTGGNHTYSRTGNTTWQLRSSWTNSDYSANDLVNHNATQVIGTGNFVGALLVWSKSNSTQSFVPITGFTNAQIGGIAHAAPPCLRLWPRNDAPWPQYVSVDVNVDTNVQWAGTLTSAGIFRYLKNPLVPPGQEIENPDLTWYKDNVYMVSKTQGANRFRFDQILMEGEWQGKAIGFRLLNNPAPIQTAEGLANDGLVFKVSFGLGASSNTMGLLNTSSGFVTAVGGNASVDMDGLGFDSLNFYAVDMVATLSDQLWWTPAGLNGTYTNQAAIPSGNNDINDLEWSYQGYLAGIAHNNRLYTIDKVLGTVSSVPVLGDIGSEDQQLWGLCRWLPCMGFREP